MTIDSLNKKIEDLTDKNKKKDNMLIIYKKNIDKIISFFIGFTY